MFSITEGAVPLFNTSLIYCGSLEVEKGIWVEHIKFDHFPPLLGGDEERNMRGLRENRGSRSLNFSQNNLFN